MKSNKGNGLCTLERSLYKKKDVEMIENLNLVALLCKIQNSVCATFLT